MENIFLNGELVSLRKPDIEKDVILGEWHQWFNDYEITKYLVHGIFPNDRESQKKIVESECKKSNSLLLSIVSNKSDQMIGVISLKNIDLINRNAEIGLVMGFSKERGCAIEAMALLTQHAFDRLNLNKLYAGQHEDLWKWVNTLETIGYKIEGLRKETGLRNGNFYDTLLTSINRTDYYALKERRSGKLISSMEEIFASKRKENPVPFLRELLASLNSIK